MNITDSWVKEYLAPRYPELVKPYRDAERITRQATARGSISKSRLVTLLRYARSNRKPLGENVASMLGQLADRLPEAQDAIRALAADSLVTARINALVALSSHELGAVHAEVLAVALSDKSAKVRELAASKIMELGIQSLKPQLERAVAHADTAEHRATLAWNLALLRDGYLVKEDSVRVWVTCRTRNGIQSTGFSKVEFETTGREWIAKTAWIGS